jgi:hypothetical protein
MKEPFGSEHDLNQIELLLFQEQCIQLSAENHQALMQLYLIQDWMPTWKRERRSWPIGFASKRISPRLLHDLPSSCLLSRLTYRGRRVSGMNNCSPPQTHAVGLNSQGIATAARCSR